MNIEELIASMTPEQIEEETVNYKAKLTSVGEKVHHNAKLTTLINQWREYEAREVELTKSAKEDTGSLMERRQKMLNEQTRLLRVRITNHNPANAKRTGETFTVSNNLIGKVAKYVPYNCEAAEAYHLPFILLETLKQRTYTKRVTRQVNGKPQLTETDVPEFSFEVLPPLTDVELKELARKQAMALGKEVE